MLRKLPGGVQKRIGRKIDVLKRDPRGSGTKKLRHEKDYYRARTGDYRILYEIEDHIVTILVIGVGHRREVYRLF